MDVRNRGVLVTGASQGLGRALSVALARRGAQVVMVARGEAALAEAVAEARGDGGIAHALAGDVADKESALAIAGAAQAVAGPIDLLVHAASTLGPVPLRLLLDTDCEDLDAVLATNVVGPFRITKAIAGSMALRGTGIVVHVTSDAAVEAYPNWGAYGASKLAAEHLARVLAAELDGTRVRVWNVDPGEMDTAMHAAALPEADRATLAKPEDVATRIVAMIAHADEIASGSRVVAASWVAR